MRVFTRHPFLGFVALLYVTSAVIILFDLQYDDGSIGTVLFFLTYSLGTPLRLLTRALSDAGMPLIWAEISVGVIACLLALALDYGIQKVRDRFSRARLP